MTLKRSTGVSALSSADSCRSALVRRFYVITKASVARLPSGVQTLSQQRIRLETCATHSLALDASCACSSWWSKRAAIHCNFSSRSAACRRSFAAGQSPRVRVPSTGLQHECTAAARVPLNETLLDPSRPSLSHQPVTRSQQVVHAKL
jgi:hypothetical protein